VLGQTLNAQTCPKILILRFSSAPAANLAAKTSAFFKKTIAFDFVFELIAFELAFDFTAFALIALELAFDFIAFQPFCGRIRLLLPQNGLTAGVTGKRGIWRTKPPDAESAVWGR